MSQHILKMCIILKKISVPAVTKKSAITINLHRFVEIVSDLANYLTLPYLNLKQDVTGS